MQPWMNCSTNNYPLYQPPVFNQPMQSPYMDRLQQLQSQQIPAMQPSGGPQGLMARFVDNFDGITANDVPMSGGAVFVKGDGTEIQFRQWTAQGTIATKRYTALYDDLDAQAIKVSSGEEKSKFDDFRALILNVQDDVRALHDRLDKMGKTNRAKKEVEEDE